MPRLKLHLLDRADFQKFYDPQIAGGGLFVPGTEPPAVGDTLTVEVVFQGGPRVLLNGTVLWRRATGDARARPGAGIGVDAQERSKLNYLLGYVRGGMLDVRDKRRLPVRLRVAYSSGRGRRVNFTRDLTEDGAFVRTSETLDVGASTTLLISPPGGEYRPIEVRATVARAQDDGDRGVGVRFDFRSVEERERYVAFLHKLETDYLDGKLPDEVLM